MTATLDTMLTATPHRTSVARTSAAGAQLDLLVLASNPTACYGVDLDSGALVRAQYPEPAPVRFDVFDVASAHLLGGDQPPDPVAPEAVPLAGPPEAIGTMAPRRAERLLKPLLHPKRAPLLGFAGPAAAYWTLRGDRPSVALAPLSSEPVVVPGRSGLRCLFTWRGLRHELPVEDPRLDGITSPVGGGMLARVLGRKPSRLVVSLTPPINGYCYKVVNGLI